MQLSHSKLTFAEKRPGEKEKKVERSTDEMSLEWQRSLHSRELDLHTAQGKMHLTHPLCEIGTKKGWNLEHVSSGSDLALPKYVSQGKKDSSF